MSYQWYSSFGVLANATGATLTLTNVQPNQAGTYWVVVTNVAGSVTSSNAVLTVNNPSPTVQITSPINQTLLARSNVVISATATNTTPGVTISWVEFFANATNSLGFAVVPTNGFYQLNWIPPIGGTDVLTALAMDNRGTNAWSGPVTNRVRDLPAVSINSPTNGSLFGPAPANVTISATALADGATITNVVFYQGTNILGADSSSPYSFTWNNVAAGAYTLKAKATDSTGLSGVSSNVVITVDTTNQPPLVMAGPNQTIDLFFTNGVQLEGFVSDDGLPRGSTLTVTWTNLSGGTNVTFVNSNLPVTSAYFWATGMYTLQLSANDSQYTVISSNLTITVVSNRPPVVYANPDLRVTNAMTTQTPGLCHGRRVAQRHINNDLERS